MPTGFQQMQNQLTAWLLRRTAPTGIRRVAPLAAAVASEIGNVREENQDRVAIARGVDRKGQDYAVVAVADGIGGMRDGSACAAMTLGTFLASVYQHGLTGSSSCEDWIKRAVNAANQAVFANFRGDGGSTLVAVLVRPGHPACWLSVGDSRVYRATGSALTQVSVDDTIAGQLGKNPEATFEQSKLLQFIGMGEGLEPHIAVLNGEPIDAMLLTTDGVHYLASSPGWLGQIVGNATDPGMCVKRLIDLAKWCGGRDNATAAMISLSSDWVPMDRPPYPCLEVWDAFGELQIIANDTARETSLMAPHHPAQTNSQAAGSARDVFTPELAPTVGNQSSKPALDSTKSRRNKAARKSKSSSGKRKKGADETSEKKAPQLFVDFPTKSG